MCEHSWTRSHPQQSEIESADGSTIDNARATTIPTVHSPAPTAPITPKVIVKPIVHTSEDPEHIEVAPDGAGAKTTVEDLPDINEAEQEIVEVSFSSGKTASSNTQQQHDDIVALDNIGLPKALSQEAMPNPAENINSASTNSAAAAETLKKIEAG